LVFLACLQVLLGLNPDEMNVFDGKSVVHMKVSELSYSRKVHESIRVVIFQKSAPQENFRVFPPAEFEGPEYYKTNVSPILADGSQVDASVYVWQDSERCALALLSFCASQSDDGTLN
jgi:hypothetical protein